jgi:NADPH-dependent 2,4-dienoyl-CoA reductase/sulfur reductase-like enzyme
MDQEIECRLNTMVIGITGEKVITLVGPEMGLLEIKARTIILTMGCRERARGSLNIPGARPAGIFSAGTAQRLVNMEGYMPGKEVVILGSGDIGLIMARRMTLEGAHVKVVAELMPYSGGLKRNIVQCLDDFDIPLKLSHTVIDIDGKERVKGVTLAKVGEDGKPVKGTEEYIPCDTLLLSVGLIPENELSQGMGVKMNAITGGPLVNESLETNIEGVFACGNVLHVHDLVDFVSEEAAAAGKSAAKYLNEGAPIPLVPEGGVRYTVPNMIYQEQMPERLTVRLRVDNVYKDCYISVYVGGKRVSRKKKQIVLPGEMEEIILKREDIQAARQTDKIVIKIEEANQSDL